MKLPFDGNQSFQLDAINAVAAKESWELFDAPTNLPAAADFRHSP